MLSKFEIFLLRLGYDPKSGLTGVHHILVVSFPNKMILQCACFNCGGVKKNLKKNLKKSNNLPNFQIIKSQARLFFVCIHFDEYS
jgi:hypothetical protein